MADDKKGSEETLRTPDPAKSPQLRYWDDDGNWKAPLSGVPALDPNPAEESGYFGVDLGSTEPGFRQFHFGFGASFQVLTAVNEGANGTLDLSGFQGKAVQFTTDGGAHVTNVVLPSFSVTGHDEGVTFYLHCFLGDPGDTAVIDLTNVRTIDGNTFNSITFTDSGSAIFFEYIDGNWRPLRGTATFDPPLPNVLLSSNNLSGLADVVAARDNLGVEIGADVQAQSDFLGLLAASGEGSPLVTNGGVVTGTNIVDFAATFGAISALTGTIETVTITGLLTTDHVTVSCIDPPPSGMIIANARVSAADTLEIYIVTAVALGITLGALNFRCLVHR